MRAASKFKHVTFVPSKDKDKWYPDLRVGGSGDDRVIACSGTLLAVAWSSNAGALAVLPVAATGKRDAATPFLVHAHSSAIHDFAFDPFNASRLATASDDGTVRLWQLPEHVAPPDSLSSPEATLSGHGASVTTLAFNPLARNVLASAASDGSLIVWRNHAQQTRVSLGSGDKKSAVESIGWDYRGAVVAAIGKDNTLRLVNARTGAVLAEAAAHDGIKPSRVLFLGNSQLLVTSGFSKSRTRELKFWHYTLAGDDASTCDKLTCVKTERLDQNTGVVELLFDVDANLLYVAGVNDGRVRGFDIRTASTKPVYMALPNVFQIDSPQRGVCLLPKRFVSVMDAEVGRLFRVVAQQGRIEPVSLVVPRAKKSRFEYVSDLYPDTHESGTPSLDADAWSSCAQPLQVDYARASLDPDVNTVAAGAVSTVTRKQEEIVLPEVHVNDVDRSTTDDTGALVAKKVSDAKSGGGGDTAAAPKKYEPSQATLRARKLIRSTHFRHVKGKELKKELNYDNVSVNQSAALHRCVATSSQCFAVPIEGIGGPIALFEYSQAGQRRPHDAPVLEAGSNVTDLEFSPFAPRTLAIALESASIGIARVPSLPLSASIGVDAQLKGHASKVSLVRFHPLADNVLVSSAIDTSVRVWDVNTQQCVLNINGALPRNMAAQSMSIDGQGQLLAVSSRDRVLRVFDLRSQREVHSLENAHAGAKGFAVTFMSTHGKLFSGGFGKGGTREVALFDVRALNKSALGRTDFGSGSGLPMPHYDEDANVCFVAARGETQVRMYEPVDLPHFLTAYSGGDPAVGLGWLPKQMCDVRSVELARCIKASPSSRLTTVTFTVPRTRNEFFQDDIFNSYPAEQPALSAQQWFDGQDAEQIRASLRPSDMTPLSDAPAIVKPPPKYRLEDNRAEEDDLGGSVWKRMNAMSGMKSNHDAAAELIDGVDESEWDD